jgi:hypothetical protein
MEVSARFGIDIKRMALAPDWLVALEVGLVTAFR